VKIGDAVLMGSCWMWLTVSVGPWWVGLAVFGVSWAGNILHDRLVKQVRDGVAEGMARGRR
jgi:hypothetical protein